MNKLYVPLPPRTLPSSHPDPPSLHQGSVPVLGTLPLANPVFAKEVISHDVCLTRQGIWDKSLLIFSAELKPLSYVCFAGYWILLR